MNLQECVTLKTKIDLIYPFLPVRIIMLGNEYALFTNIKTLPPGAWFGDIESDILCWSELNELVDVYWDGDFVLICEDYLHASWLVSQRTTRWPVPYNSTPT